MSESILSVRKARVQFMNDIAKSGLEPENDEICKKYYDFKADVTKKALHILTDDIPRKILYFNELVVRVSCCTLRKTKFSRFCVLSECEFGAGAPLAFARLRAKHFAYRR